MAAKPTTIAAYLNALPTDRRAAIDSIRAVVNRNIDSRFAEGMQYGMPAWFLPHSEYPDGYHCDPKQPLPFASIASQKSHIGIYLFCVYTSPEEKQQFIEEWEATGKRLNMGASCVRVKKLEDVPLDVLGRAIKRMTAKKFVATYESARAGHTKKGSAKKAAKKTAKKTAKKAVKKAAAKKKATKVATKKSATKKAATTKKALAKKTAGKKTAKKVATRATTKKATRKKTAKKAARRA